MEEGEGSVVQVKNFPQTDNVNVKLLFFQWSLGGVPEPRLDLLRDEEGLLVSNSNAQLRLGQIIIIMVRILHCYPWSSVQDTAVMVIGS